MRCSRRPARPREGRVEPEPPIHPAVPTLGEMVRRRWLLVAAAAVVVALAATGVVALVGSGDAGRGVCAEPVQDPLDPRSLQHSLPGAPSPSYATEPPTSGPHQAGRLPGGVAPEPLPGPVQVGALEAGQVLLQHRDLPAAERRVLESLAGPMVVVAPNPALPAPVVASAWRTRQVCRYVDVAALTRFVREHGGRDPAHAG